MRQSQAGGELCQAVSGCENETLYSTTAPAPDQHPNAISAFGRNEETEEKK